MRRHYEITALYIDTHEILSLYLYMLTENTQHAKAYTYPYIKYKYIHIYALPS